MVTRKRVNLSLSEADYQRLKEIASNEGKTVSGLSLDIIKATLHGGRFKRVAGSPQKPQKATESQKPIMEPKQTEKPLGSLKTPLTRQQRRAIDRQNRKK